MTLLEIVDIRSKNVDFIIKAANVGLNHFCVLTFALIYNLLIL